MMTNIWKVEEKESVLSLLTPILNIASVVGSYPVNSRLEISWVLVVYSFLLTLHFPYLLFYNWSLLQEFWNDYWSANPYFGVALSTISFLNYVVCVLTVPVNIKSFRKCLFRFENIEYTFAALGVPVSWENGFFRPTILGCIGLLALFAFDTLFRYIRYDNFASHNILYLMIAYYSSVSGLTYSTMLFRSLFTFIKSYLKHCTLVFREGRSKCISIANKHSLRLRELLAIFESLCQVSRRVNRMFGMMTISLSFHWFVVTVIVTYNFVNSLSKSRVDYFIFINQFLVVGFLSVVFWHLIESVSDAANQAKQFTQTVYEIMISENNHLSKEEEELFKMHLSRKREISLMVCGLFPLDRTLAHSIFATATTYLVILIQFGDKDKESAQDQLSTEQYEYPNGTSMMTPVTFN